VGFGQTRTPAQLPVLTMVTGYSRWLTARLIPTRRAEDLFAGWWRLMVGLEAVPRTLVWDGEGAIGRWRGGKTELTLDCQGFRGVLGTKVIVLKPREPEHKGIIERAHDYLERSFLPGRTFAGPDDFNAQLQGWLDIVNTRRRRALGCAPTDRITADRQAMLALPPIPPAVGWRSSTRLARDHYVRLDSNDYSVHPGVIGRRIEVVADLDRIKVYCEGRVVADHQRVWAWHQTLTDPAHLAAADILRRTRVGALRPVRESEVEQRALADYDTALGIDMGNDLDEGGYAS
jgi:transposase